MTKERIRTPKPFVVALITLVGLAAVARTVFLTRHSLWYDEGTSIYASGGASVGESLSRTLFDTGSERYQPLYFTLLHVWRAVFGSGEWAGAPAGVGRAK